MWAFVFMEKIKRNSGRVNIKKLGSGDITGDAVTGGYIFSIDKGSRWLVLEISPNNEPNAVIQFSYVYPKLEDIVPSNNSIFKVM